MAATTFLLEEFTGADTRVEVSMDEDSSGGIDVSLRVITEDGNLPGDIEGFFFNISDKEILKLLQISGDRVGNSASGFYQDSKWIQISSVTKGDEPNDASAEISPREYDFGIGIGPQGWANDPVLATSFKISRSDGVALSLDSFTGQNMGVRMQSVGDNQEESSKLNGVVNVGPPLMYGISIDKSVLSIEHAQELPEWSVLRSSGHPIQDEKYDWVGEKIVYQFVVTNTGDDGASLRDPQIRDSLIKSDEIVYVSGDNGDRIFQPGERWIWQGSYQVEQPDLDLGSKLNTASAFATANGKNVVSNEDSETVFAYQLPSILVTKSANSKVADEVGDIINYEIGALNNGNVTLSRLSVDDSLLSAGAEYFNGDNGNSLLDVGEKWTFKGEYQVGIKDFDNKGLVDGFGDGWIDNTASAEAFFGSDPVTGQATARVQLVNPFEGLSQGYWRNHSWEGLGFSEEDSFDATFLNPNSVTWKSKANPLYGDDITLYEALTANGGGKWALAREAVAGVLNAERFGKEYRFKADDIKIWVNAALNNQTVDIYGDGSADWASGQATIDGLQRLLNQYNGNY
jgi:hypothetical protein